MNYFSKNIQFLRKSKGLKQNQMQAELGIGATAWNNYENGISKPGLDTLIDISNYFGVSESDLLHIDVSTKGNLIGEGDDSKKHKKGNPMGNPIGNPNADLEPISRISERSVGYGADDTIPIPITDISVAAGTGIYNGEYIDNAEVIRIPANLLKRGSTYLTVRVKGTSMAPTLQDGSYMIIRHLDRSEWAKLRDEYIYVICDTEGKVYLKRVKNRLKQQFIVLKSDNPDKVSYPNFNLNINEIQSIWFAELYLTARMPNIHDQYYTRLQTLEDRVEDLVRSLVKPEPKLK